MLLCHEVLFDRKAHDFDSMILMSVIENECYIRQRDTVLFDRDYIILQFVYQLSHKHIRMDTFTHLKIDGLEIRFGFDEIPF